MDDDVCAAQRQPDHLARCVVLLIRARVYVYCREKKKKGDWKCYKYSTTRLLLLLLVPRKNFRAILDSPLQFLPFWLCALGQVGRVSVKGLEFLFSFLRGGRERFLFFFLPEKKKT